MTFYLSCLLPTSGLPTTKGKVNCGKETNRQKIKQEKTTPQSKISRSEGIKRGGEKKNEV